MKLKVSYRGNKSFTPGKQEFHAGETRVSRRGNKSFAPGKQRFHTGKHNGKSGNDGYKLKDKE
ncbi:hypothetical protein [Bacteroides faecis]|uniref:hypothetical protein n=1 Tax=Bacteroides faecis TaxID=674529 RepID=UPI0039C8AB50